MAERNAERRGLERRDEKPWRLISVEGDKINAVRLGVESRKICGYGKRAKRDRNRSIMECIFVRVVKFENCKKLLQKLRDLFRMYFERGYIFSRVSSISRKFHFKVKHFKKRKEEKRKKREEKRKELTEDKEGSLFSITSVTKTRNETISNRLVQFPRNELVPDLLNAKRHR